MRQPIHSALCLLMTLLSVAGIFVLQNAEFLFAVQILVYTGGIMVLFIFTIMLVNVKRAAKEAFVHKQTGLAVVGGLAIAEARRLTGSDLAEPADPARLATVTVESHRTVVVDGKPTRTMEK